MKKPLDQQIREIRCAHQKHVDAMAGIISASGLTVVEDPALRSFEVQIIVGRGMFRALKEMAGS